jgi:hypothetical protein
VANWLWEKGYSEKGRKLIAACGEHRDPGRGERAKGAPIVACAMLRLDDD